MPGPQGWGNAWPGSGSGAPHGLHGRHMPHFERKVSHCVPYGPQSKRSSKGGARRRTFQDMTTGPLRPGRPNSARAGRAPGEARAETARHTPGGRSG
jgi:hypothetical protein